MLLLITLILASCSLNSANVLKNGRRYFPHEEQVTTAKFIYIIDDDGVAHYEDLTRSITDIEVNITDIKLYLYTNENDDGEPISLESLDDLKNSPYYNPSLKNVFTAHGYSSSHDSGVTYMTREAILRKGENVNLFAIDWHIPASQFYTYAVWSVPIIGRFIGEYVNKMMEKYDITPSDFILIGHSLGAHIVGCTGANINGQVTQIIGLDPAWPLFSLADIDNRIDETDGEIVHIVHTNAGFQGFLSSIGDADYFFNGGVKQAGCGPDISNSCSHNRAVDLYAESIISTAFRALQCSSHENFLSGDCDGNREVVFGGYLVDGSIFGDFYLDTAGSSPFALG
ncbi:Lipase [Popillia japonica]|uniref:Lipase n=1 Tax=Popillia japonica TaxID=7064 RepID=A0AAW1KJJ3_POPJA